MPCETRLEMRTVIVLALAAFGGCAESPMMGATATFAGATQTSIKELGAGPRLVMEICRESAEIRYMQDAGVLAQPTFREWFERPGGSAASPAPSARQVCARYRQADDGFEHALKSLQAYAEALEAIAGDSDTKVKPADFGAAVQADAEGLAALGDQKVKTFSNVLAAAAKPLGAISGALLEHWEKKQLRTVVASTDQPFREVVRQLLAFLDVIRREQLAEVRDNVGNLRQQIASAPNDKPTVSDRTTAAYVDVALSRRLDRLELKLGHLRDLLNAMGRAHEELNKGWQHDEAGAVDTVKAVAAFAKDIYASVKSFQTAQTGDAP